MSSTYAHRDANKRREYMRNYMRKRQGSVLRDDAPFVGIDGEGGGEQGDKHNGYHAYFLLRAGTSSIVPRDNEFRLRTEDCLKLLCDLPPDAIYVGYFFDYDVTKMLEDVPFPKLRRLMERQSRTRGDGKGTFPVTWREFEIDYLPRKEFRVRRMVKPRLELPSGEVTPPEWSKWVVINDVGSFFQCKFVEALKKWGIGTEEERALISAGKDMRGNFEFNDIEEIDRYNAMEIKLLQELMEKFRKACKATEVVPARWQGPGQIAKTLMRRNGVPRTRDVPLLNDDRYAGLLEYARAAYYGGRPELLAIGPVDRCVWQYDINSAYPRAMLDVPCLIHGGWEYRSYSEGIPAVDVSSDIAIVYGRFTPLPSNETRYPMWYGLPFRTKNGTIVYPANGKGWYWNFEIESARHQDFTAYSAWIYHRRCDCRPLGFVEDVYRQRLELGKDDAGQVLKLGLNSLYGICVQSIGNPQYSNGIWGSFITAHCRTTIQNFIHSSPSCRDPKAWCGKDILMIATDSVATWRERPDIAPSPPAPPMTGLGEWGVEVHPDGMFLVQPGLYFGSNGKAPKTRGVPRAVVESKSQEFRDAFDRMLRSGKLEDGDVSVPQRLFVGIRYALQRRNTKLLGQWISFENFAKNTSGKTIRFDWTNKRASHPVLNPLPGVHSYIETFPKSGDPNAETVPYAKDIGGLLQREELRDVLKAQPDWSPIFEGLGLKGI